MNTATTRKGFVLLVVLVFIVAATAVSTGVVMTARASQASGRNRIAYLRSQWVAEGCIEQFLADASTDTLTVDEWSRLDERLAEASFLPCAMHLSAAGDRIDLTRSDPQTLRNLFRSVGAGIAESDTLLASLLDWQDPDTLSRGGGSEQQWYRERSRPEPSNLPLRGIAEARLVRGFEALGELEALATVDGGRYTFSHTPLDVLRLIDGLSDPAAREIVRRRDGGGTMLGLQDLIGSLNGPAQAAILRAQEALLVRFAVVPDFWTLDVAVRSPGERVVARLDARLRYEQGRLRVVRRRRSWGSA